MRFEKMKKIFILLIILLPLGAKVFAQDSLPTVPHYSFRLDSTTIMLGDQTVLAVEKGPVYPSLDDLTNHDVVAVRQWMDTADGTLYTFASNHPLGAVDGVALCGLISRQFGSVKMPVNDFLLYLKG